MPWIENISLNCAKIGWHYFQPHKTILIQIQEKGTTEFIVPKYKDEFVRIYQFDFDDSETGDEYCITDEQAENIVKILASAYLNDMNIVVHCHAGICRSGAVAEVGEMLGFQYAGNFKSPNLLVKSKLMNVLNRS